MWRAAHRYPGLVLTWRVKIQILILLRYTCAHIWVCDRFIATVGVFIMKVTGKARLLLLCTFPLLDIQYFQWLLQNVVQNLEPIIHSKLPQVRVIWRVRTEIKLWRKLRTVSFRECILFKPYVILCCRAICGQTFHKIRRYLRTEKDCIV
jgi:hypothetical protein